MTRQQLITRIVSNPAVVRAHTRIVNGQPVSPEASMMENLADGWIDTVIEEMLSFESIRRGASQQQYSLALTGTDTYTLPVSIGRVLDITLSENNAPLHNFVTISDYNRWRHEVNPNPTADDTTVGYYFPSRDPTTQALKITFVHAAVSGQTATVWFLAQSEPPYSLSVFPVTVHHVILHGVLAYMTGSGGLDAVYRQAIERVGRQLTPRVGGYSRARHDPKWRMKNWRRSNMANGSSSYYWPPHQSN